MFGMPLNVFYMRSPGLDIRFFLVKIVTLVWMLGPFFLHGNHRVSTSFLRTLKRDVCTQLQ